MLWSAGFYAIAHASCSSALSAYSGTCLRARAVSSPHPPSWQQLRALHIREPSSRAPGVGLHCFSLSLSLSLSASSCPSVKYRFPRRLPPLLSPQPQVVQASASYIMEKFGQLVTSQRGTFQSYSHSSSRQSCTRDWIIGS